MTRRLLSLAGATRAWVRASARRNAPQQAWPQPVRLRFSFSGRACPLGLGGERLGQIGALPGELRLGAAEVPVGRGLLVDGSQQIEHLAQTIGCQVEMLADELRQALARQAAGAESLHHDR